MIIDGWQTANYIDKITKTMEGARSVSNETIKKFDITIKLRGDNVYDLYIDGNWMASRGSCETILDEVRNAVKKSLLEC